MTEKGELEAIMCQWTSDVESVSPRASKSRPRRVKVGARTARQAPTSPVLAIRDLSGPDKARIAELIRELARVSGQRAELESRLQSTTAELEERLRSAEEGRRQLEEERTRLAQELEAARVQKQEEKTKEMDRPFTASIDAELRAVATAKDAENPVHCCNCIRRSPPRPLTSSPLPSSRVLSNELRMKAASKDPDSPPPCVCARPSLSRVVRSSPVPPPWTLLEELEVGKAQRALLERERQALEREKASLQALLELREAKRTQTDSARPLELRPASSHSFVLRPELLNPPSEPRQSPGPSSGSISDSVSLPIADTEPDTLGTTSRARDRYLRRPGRQPPSPPSSLIDLIDSMSERAEESDEGPREDEESRLLEDLFFVRLL